MKLSLAFLALALSSPAFADVITVKGRVFTGISNPQIAPFGSIVDMDTGKILDVGALISTLAPKQLDRGCLYEFHYIRQPEVPYGAITLVPPTTEISCGNDFGRDR